MNIKFIFLLVAIAVFSSCQQAPATEAASTASSPTKKGMTKIAIMYPNGEGHTFDMEYYSSKHMPMCAELFGDALNLYEIEKGIAGRTPDEPIPYLAVGYFYFDKLEDYQNAFGPNAEQILNDIPNYTNIQPVVQISEVVH